MNLDTAGKRIAFVLGFLILGVIAFMILQTVYHAWWVSTHCTLILGTEVCR